MIADMLPPPDARRAPDAIIYDPLPPPDAGRGDVRDAGNIVYDPAPPPDAARPDAGPDYMIADMLPPNDAGVQKVDAPFPVSDPPVAPIGALSSDRGAPGATENVGHWADTTPRWSPRARDLPLCLPPEIRVTGEWVDGAVQVCLTGAEEPLSIRWQSDGEVVGTDRQVTWAPSSDDDQLNVAVRSRDGVAVAELRLCQVRGRRG